MEKVLYIIAGMFLGAVFQNDIPLFKNINHQKIRSHLVQLVGAITEGAVDAVEITPPELKSVEITPPEIKITDPKRKRMRKGRKINPKDMDL
tara:strand:- start:372 stop:647 length:276 start_codon:yes stop_codon:yes gene_type:complete